MKKNPFCQRHDLQYVVVRQKKSVSAKSELIQFWLHLLEFLHLN